MFSVSPLYVSKHHVIDRLAWKHRFNLILKFSVNGYFDDPNPFFLLLGAPPRPRGHEGPAELLRRRRRRRPGRGRGQAPGRPQHGDVNDPAHGRVLCLRGGDDHHGGAQRGRGRVLVPSEVKIKGQTHDSAPKTRKQTTQQSYLPFLSLTIVTNHNQK